MEKEENENIITLEEIELAPPDPTKFTTIQSLYSRLEDCTVTLRANPKNYNEFESILSCFNEWLNYTLMCNEKNLLTYVKHNIETGKYSADYVFLALCKNYIKLIDPLYEIDIEKTQQQYKEQQERRKQQDEIAEQKRLDEKNRVWRESMEKSRKFSQEMREAEERRKRAALKQDEDEW